jgi:hypothetical protein
VWYYIGIKRNNLLFTESKRRWILLPLVITEMVGTLEGSLGYSSGPQIAFTKDALDL